MRTIKKFTALTIMSLVIAFAAGCSQSPVAVDTKSVPSSSDSTVNLIFDTPRSIDEVSAFSRTNSLNILEMRLQRHNYVAGYRIDGQDPSVVARTFAEEHRKFLMMLMKHDEPEYAQLRSAAMSELATLSATSLRISSITVEGTSNMVKDLPQVRLSELPISADSPGPAVEPSTLKPTVEPNSVGHPSLMWAPYGGTSEVNKSYSYQRFIFNDLSKLGSGMATYEHETHIWDKSYANQTGYWVSNMPNAYLDCGNNDSVDNFAVGTFTANQLRTYTWYYAYIGLVGQSSASSTVSIWAQRGTRWGWSCWYVTSNEHAGPLATHYAGGGMSWQF